MPPWVLLRTAEKRHPCYNYTWDKACGTASRAGKGASCGNVFPHSTQRRVGSNRSTWNANSWPYETARVLHGMANVLIGNQSGVAPRTTEHLNPSGYWRLLKQFARQHTASYCVQDTAKPTGSGHVCENIHPDLGYWNTRQWRYLSGASPSDVDKGSDYFHSSFIDLVISGLLGIRTLDGKPCGVHSQSLSRNLTVGTLKRAGSISSLEDIPESNGYPFDADSPRLSGE